MKDTHVAILVVFALVTLVFIGLCVYLIVKNNDLIAHSFMYYVIFHHFQSIISSGVTFFK